MINTIAELLLKLKEIEKEEIDKLGIKHTPTIGNMYEGLTSHILDKSIPTGLELYIVRNSFIRKEDDSLSAEMDVMLITGKGTALPHSQDQYIVDFNQVILVIQSKKKINRQHLGEAYENLKNVYNSAYGDKIPNYAGRILRDAYRGITGEDIIDGGKIRKYFDTTTKEQLFHILKLESFIPPRIVFGYEGYTTEAGLRKGFIDFMQENISSVDEIKYGFGPANFPSLIINGQFSLIKNNGMPYVGKIDEKGWPVYSTSNQNPLMYFLEILWTRLDYMFKIDSLLFGEDLAIDESHPFIHTNAVYVGGRMGWNMSITDIPKKILKEELIPVEWEPVKITEEQHLLIAYLCKHDKLLLTKINQLLLKHGFDEMGKDFVDNLIGTGLVCIDGRKHLKLLTDECRCIMLKDGTYAADDKSGRLTRWAEKKIGKKFKNILDLRGDNFRH
jgi:hypothetical protein